MADELTPDALNQIAASASNASNATDDLTKSADKTRTVLNRAGQQMTRFEKQVTSVAKKMGLMNTEFDFITSFAKDLNKEVPRLGKVMTTAFLSGGKELSIMAVGYQRLIQSLELSTQKAQEQGLTFESLTENLRELGIELVENQKRQKQLTDATGKTKEETAAAAVQTMVLKEREMDLAKSLVQTEGQLIQVTMQFEKHRTSIIESNDQIITYIQNQREMNRKMREMQGGVGALSAKMEGLAEAKFWTTFNNLLSGATILTGLAMIGESFTAVANHMDAVRKVTSQLGGQDFPSFTDSLANSTIAIKSMNSVAFDLGMTFEEVSAIADKVRIGTRFDRQGQLTEAAIAGMTREAATFSKVTGIDAAEAVDMMDVRIKSMGETSAQATGELRLMRVTLSQMAVASSGSNVAMDDMVRLINEASGATQSYVVDTRLMTQALRGAATQALNLGANQKLAQDVAKSVGKTLSKTPDFIEIPAGFNLLSKLLDPDTSKDFLSHYDSATQKQLLLIKEGGKSMSGAKAIMQLIGGGMDAQEEKIKKITAIWEKARTGEEAAVILVEQGLAENELAAMNMLKSYREATRLAKKFGDDNIRSADLVGFSVDNFRESIKDLEASDALDKLSQMGMSPESAAAFQASLKDEASQTKLLLDNKIMTQMDINKLEMLSEKDRAQHLDDMTTLYLKRVTDPTHKAMADLAKLTSGDITFNADAKKLKEEFKKFHAETGMSYEKIAEKVGITDEAASAQFVKDMKDNRKSQEDINKNYLGRLRAASEKANLAQLGMVDFFMMAFKNGPIEGLKTVFNELFSTNSPIVNGVLGLATVAGGIYALLKGRSFLKMFGMLPGRVELGAYEGVLAGVMRTGRIGNEGGGGGQLPAGDSGSGKAKGKVQGPPRPPKPQTRWQKVKGGAGKLRKFGGKFGGIASAGMAAISMFGLPSFGSEATAEALPKAPEVPKAPTLSKFTKAPDIQDPTLSKFTKAPDIPKAPLILPKGGAKSAGKLAKFAKMGSKSLKALPFVGTAIGGYFAYEQALEIYDKFRRGEPISAADKLKMSMTLGSMIPGIGTFVALADMSADVAGAYDMIDSSAGASSGLDTMMNAGIGAGIGGLLMGPAGMMAGAAFGGRAIGGGGGGGPQMLKTSANSQSLSSDGKLTLEIKNFADVLTKHKNISDQAGGGFFGNLW